MPQANLTSPAPGLQANMIYIRPTSKGPELAQAGSLHVSRHGYGGKDCILLELA